MSDQTVHAAAVIRLNVTVACLQDISAAVNAVEMNLPHEIERLRLLATDNPEADDLLGIADSLAEELARLAGKYRLIAAALQIAWGQHATIPPELHGNASWYQPGSAEHLLERTLIDAPTGGLDAA